MMTKEKQIEEMAKLLHLNYDMPYAFSKGLAEFLIDEGWCKASEVAREIFEEIAQELNKISVFYDKNEDAVSVTTKFYNAVISCLGKVRKKYTEGRE